MFAVSRGKTHDKVLCLLCVLRRRKAKFYVCRAFYVGALQNFKKK
jgi:hypothetical protein